MSNFKRSLYAVKAKTPYEKSLLKATYDGDTDPPKEKHVQIILWALQGHNPQSPPEHALNLLIQRLMVSGWGVVIKALIIIHRGVEQIGQGYSGRIAEMSVSLSNFFDSSERGSAHNRIIQEYFNYIKSFAINNSRRESILLVEPGQRAEALSKLSNQELVKEVDLLLTQLKNLVKLGPLLNQTIRNYRLKVTSNVAQLVLKDGSNIYRSVSLGIDRILEQFKYMPRQLAELCVEHNKIFERCTKLLQQFYEMGHSMQFQGLNPPTFAQRSIEISASMETHVQSSSPHQDSEPLPSDLGLSREELEQQRIMLEEYEKEHQRKLKERDILGDVQEQSPQSSQKSQLFQQAQSPSNQQPSPQDIVMQSFQAQQPGQQHPMMTGMPMGYNPMMTGMPMGYNPMMTGMPMGYNPMMTGMPMGYNPMMTGMPMGFMQQAMQTQIKANMDPNSRAYGQVNQGNQPHQPHNQQGNNPFETQSHMGQQNNPFGTQASGQQNNPFGGQSNPSSTQAPKQNDPFRDLIQSV